MLVKVILIYSLDTTILREMNIPEFPAVEDLGLEHQPDLEPFFQKVPWGISELTFANLYLFRKTYRYQVTRIDQTVIIFGFKEGKKFALCPGSVPLDQLPALFSDLDYIKCLSESQKHAIDIIAEKMGFCVSEDRDNFDYLYLRTDLAELRGKKFHKKRNLVKQFNQEYQAEEAPITNETVDDALEVLEAWREARGEDGDYTAAKEALELRNELKLNGTVYYVQGKPIGYTLGEQLGDQHSYAIHFEKALGLEYKGVYQYINKAFAENLPDNFLYVNREQDLGDEGLRQAKLSYRPVGFVKKFRLFVRGKCPCHQEESYVNVG
jgi:hypothetical protein